MKKELLEKVRNEYVKIDNGNEKYTKWHMENVGGVVELENGGYIVIEKPRIETTFCFSYGWNGIYDEDMFNSASNREREIYQHEVFKEKNLAELNERINDLKNIRRLNFTDEWLRDHKYFHGERMQILLCYKYNAGNIYSYNFLWEQNARRTESEAEVYDLTETDINNLISGLDEVKQAFSKRLDSYLKRYGTSKLRTWTFLSD